MNAIANNPSYGAGEDRRETQICALEVEIVSDVICPWCYVAKKKFEKAKAELPGDVTVSVRWQPFELNPYMPPEGMDRRAYRSQKFGSWKHSQQLDAQVSKAGAEVGIDFHHELMERTPNTLAAHRLIWLADSEDAQGPIVEALFSACFVFGKDVGDQAILIDLAANAGISREKAVGLFSGDEGIAEVRRAEALAQRNGISSVPSFVVNGKLLFSGAQPSEIMLAHLLDAARSA